MPSAGYSVWFRTPCGSELTYWIDVVALSTFATDGFEFSPLVEKAKIDTLRLPTPFRTPRLTDDEYAMIMGGTMARLLGL